ncbi:ankyrin repeat domain-containing protein [Bacteroidota bacterium]
MKIITGILSVLILFTLTGCGKQEDYAPRIAIHTAAAMGSLKSIERHIKAGSDLNEKDQYGSTPLIVAITFGKPEVVKVLIEAGADIQIKNSDGASPLHIAAFFCHPEIVKALLDKGADKTEKNSSGNTPYETVAAPFDQVKGIYDFLGTQLQPLGITFDYDYIETTRPKIAEMLQ